MTIFVGSDDNGRGVKSSHTRRGDSSRSRAAGSTGLGLSIVHAVVTAHGGTVGVDSRPGRTEFTVRLPLALQAAAHPVHENVAQVVQ